MTLALTTLPNGRVVVEIADAAGEIHRYLYRPLVAPPGWWRIELSRLDPEGLVAAVYIVTLRPAGGWHCTCPQATYRRAVCNLQQGCKHCLMARELRLVLAGMGLAPREEYDDVQQ